MNQFKNRQAGTAGRIALAGLLSVAMLLVCSKNSPLYPMNDWVDVNCFFTIGRGIRHGLVPYLDLYEQKGPLLYAVYALAAWISETGFIGVFIVETVCFATYLYFSGRTAETLSGTPAAYAWTWRGSASACRCPLRFPMAGARRNSSCRYSRWRCSRC